MLDEVDESRRGEVRPKCSGEGDDDDDENLDAIALEPAPTV